MAETLKFTFDTSFGTRSEGEVVDQILPVISQSEVDAARTQGFVQGREDGIAEAKAQFNDEFKTTLEKISANLGSVLSTQASNAAIAIEQAENYSLLIAQKIAKAALTQHPTHQIKVLISDCLSHINLMPHLVIRVNQSITELVQKELQPIIEQSGYDGKLVILGEEDMPLGDCMIEWADGGVAHTTQEIVEAISDKLAAYFGFDVEAVQAADAAALNQTTDGLLDENQEPQSNGDEDDIFSAEAAEDYVETTGIESDLNTEIEPGADAQVLADEPLDQLAELELSDEMDDLADDDDIIEIVQKKQTEQVADDETLAATSLEGQDDE